MTIEAPGRFSVRGRARGTAKNSEGQNLLDHAHGFSAALDAIIRLLVIGQALLVEFTKTGFVAEERPVAHQYTSLQQVLHRAIEPDDDGSGTSRRQRQTRGAARRCVAARTCRRRAPGPARVSRSDAEPRMRARHSCSIRGTPLRPSAQKFGKLARPVCAFDFRVEIGEMPGELRGQQTAHRALARAHETGQANHAAFRDRPRHGLVRWG